MRVIYKYRSRRADEFMSACMCLYVCLQIHTYAFLEVVIWITFLFNINTHVDLDKIKILWKSGICDTNIRGRTFLQKKTLYVFLCFLCNKTYRNSLFWFETIWYKCGVKLHILLNVSHNIALIFNFTVQQKKNKQTFKITYNPSIIIHDKNLLTKKNCKKYFALFSQQIYLNVKGFYFNRILSFAHSKFSFSNPCHVIIRKNIEL